MFLSKLTAFAAVSMIALAGSALAQAQVCSATGKAEFVAGHTIRYERVTNKDWVRDIILTTDPSPYGGPTVRLYSEGNRGINGAWEVSPTEPCVLQVKTSMNDGFRFTITSPTTMIAESFRMGKVQETVPQNILPPATAK
nr:hypothetical protein [uncultured Rhodopila sp.]